MDEQGKKLRCRFCDWQIELYVQKKDGEIKDNWSALGAHVANRHPDEFLAIRRSLVSVRERIKQLSGDAIARECFPRKNRFRKTNRITRTRKFLDSLTPELYFDGG